MEKESYAVKEGFESVEETIPAAPVGDFPFSAATVIKPFNSWFSLDWRSLWNYRELLYFLVWRDVKIRYKQTFLGVAWVVLQPLLTTLIFTVLFSRFNPDRQAGVAYPLIVFIGFVIWSFVNTAVNNSSNSLVNYSNLITKVYFPRLLIPVAAVGSCVLDFGINLLLFLAVAVLSGGVLSWKLLLFPFLLLLLVLLVTGIGVFLSALNVLFRDVRQIVVFGLQVWLFLSPVFYTLELVPERWRWLWRLNPLVGVLENLRAAIFDFALDLPSLAISVGFTLIIFVGSLFLFNRLENDFADVI